MGNKLVVISTITKKEKKYYNCISALIGYVEERYGECIFPARIKNEQILDKLYPGGYEIKKIE